MIRCSRVLLEDFTIIDGPQWTIHPVYCEHVVVRGVNVSTHGPNTDGLNPDSCSDVLIQNCTFETGDDCIALNSGMNEDGWRVNRPCEHIEIRNCVMNGGHGGIVIGSAVSGGIRDVWAHDCIVRSCMQGIRLKSMRGRGGYIEDARFDHIVIQNATREGIQINQFYEYSTVQPMSDRASAFRNIQMSHIEISGAPVGIRISGLPELPITDVSFRAVQVDADRKMECSNVQNFSMS